MHKNSALPQIITKVLSILVLFLGGQPVFAGQILNAEEVKALFSDKTVYSYHERKRFDIVLYYGALKKINNDEPKENKEDKNKDENKAKNKTSKTANSDKSEIKYVGVLKGMRNKRKSSGTWWVSKNGEICVKRVVISRCRIVIKENGIFKKYKVSDRGENTLTETINLIEEGNSKNY
jgi:hypothetical protein